MPRILPIDVSRTVLNQCGLPAGRVHEKRIKGAPPAPRARLHGDDGHLDRHEPCTRRSTSSSSGGATRDFGTTMSRRCPHRRGRRAPACLPIRSSTSRGHTPTEAAPGPRHERRRPRSRHDVDQEHAQGIGESHRSRGLGEPRPWGQPGLKLLFGWLRCSRVVLRRSGVVPTPHHASAQVDDIAQAPSGPSLWQRLAALPDADV